MGDISKDLLKCIALLSSLGSEFAHLRSIITRDISAATSSKPFTSIQLRTYLNGEQSLLDSDNKRANVDSIALPAHVKNVIVCTNCKRNGHVTTYCISPGGGMAGRSIDESKQARRHDRELKNEKKGAPMNPQPKGKVSVKVQGADGHAYFMLVDAEDLVMPTPITATEFAGIATISETPSTSGTAEIEEIEYAGWLAVEEELDIAMPPTSVDPSALTASHMNEPSTYRPFWLDTGASIHISPDRHDFISLQSTPPKTVRGLGGTSVTAVGIGDIELHVEGNDRFRL